jgi:hypothetical protein
MADIEVAAAYGSVVEDEGTLFVGFAEGEEEDGGYVLFRQTGGAGPIWFEVTDEAFGAEDAVASVQAGAEGLVIRILPERVAAFGWAGEIAVRIAAGADGRDEAFAALAAMLGPLWQEG